MYMANTFSANFTVNPPIMVRVVEEDKKIDMDLGLEIAGQYTYHINDDIAFFHQGFDVNDPAKKFAFESRLLSSMHCTMSLFWSENVAKGIAHDDIPDLFGQLRSYIVNDLQGGFCKLTGIALDSMDFTTSRISPNDEKKYRSLVTEFVVEYPDEATFNGNYTDGTIVNLNGQTIDMAHKLPPKTKFKWQCPCGRINETAFCPGCGRPKDATSVLWICSCGKKNSTRFCTNCGNRRD